MKRPEKEKAIARLQKALDGLPELRNQSEDSAAFEKWRRDTQIAITHTFGEKSRHLGDFNNIRYGLQIASSFTPDSAFQEAYVQGLQLAQAVLQSMIEEVEEYWEEQETAGSQNARLMDDNTRNVFIIHGHDHGTKDTVARFVAKLNLNPIILHEQPNQGRTIIEKSEANAEVVYAIALLTPDDVGAAKSDVEKRHDRPRQNVVFEFGYFIGRLGRKRVCGLTKGNVEIPSDYSGVLYISLDEAGGWRTTLLRELKAAGIQVDANLAF